MNFKEKNFTIEIFDDLNLYEIFYKWTNDFHVNCDVFLEKVLFFLVDL